jgi:Flp pilus assembly pilin Flp
MRTSIKNIISNFIKDDHGQDMVEYSLVLVLIGTVALIFISGLGLSVSGIVSTVGQKLEAVSSAIT